MYFHQISHKYKGMILKIPTEVDRKLEYYLNLKNLRNFNNILSKLYDIKFDKRFIS